MIGFVVAVVCVLLAALLGYFGWLTVQLIEIKVNLAEVRVALKDRMDDFGRRLSRVERHVGLEDSEPRR